MLKVHFIICLLLFVAACHTDSALDDGNLTLEPDLNGIKNSEISIDVHTNELISYTPTNHYKKALAVDDSIQVIVKRQSSLSSHIGRETEFKITSIGTSYSSVEWRDKRARYNSLPANSEAYSRLLAIIEEGGVSSFNDYRLDDCWSCETDEVEIVQHDKSLKFSYDYDGTIDYGESTEFIELIRELTNG